MTIRLFHKGMMSQLLTALAISLSLSGCAGMPLASKADNNFDVLYDGKSKTAYATEFPVNSAEEAIAKADSAAHGGDMDMALFYYVQALRHDAENDETYYKIGAIHAQRNNLPLAKLALTQSLKLNPDNAAAMESLGLLHLEQRDYDKARSLLAKSVEKDPHRWRALDALGVIDDLDGNYEAAATHYKKALEYWPDSALVLNNYGYSRYLAGDDDTALQQFRKALQRNPQFERSWMNLGLVCVRRAQYAQAVDAFKRIVSEAEAYNNVGYLCMIEGAEQKDPGKARALYKTAEDFLNKAIRLSPRYYAVANDNLEKLSALRKGNKPRIPALVSALTLGRLGNAKSLEPVAEKEEFGHVEDAAARHLQTTYRVSKGDTLYSIARQHGLQPQHLMELNHLQNANIKAGQLIRLLPE